MKGLILDDAIPPNTKKSTSQATKAFDEWLKSRNKNGNAIPELAVFTVEDVNHCLPRFIVEVRKLKVDFYSPKSLYMLTTGILRGMHEQGNNKTFMGETDNRFLIVRKMLDAQTKMLTAKGKCKLIILMGFILQVSLSDN